MDLQATRAQSGPKWVLARAGVLALFVLTGILLVASLNTQGSLRAGASTSPAISFDQPAVSIDGN